LIKALDDESWQVRAYAAELLGMMGDKRAMDALREKLDDDNYIVREAAQESIWTLNQKRTIIDLY
jgi:HEAT repeat protein